MTQEYSKLESTSNTNAENTNDSINNISNTNNIFLNVNNLNHGKKEERVILNLVNPPNSFREISIAFSRNNIYQVLKGKVTYNALVSKLRHRGKHKPIIKDEEVERIIYRYKEVVSSLDNNTLSYYDEDVVTSFISLYKNNSINNIISFYVKKPNARNTQNSYNTTHENIMCNFNVDMFRQIYFGINPNDMTFNPHEDRELFILDYIRMYWELYMLLVFLDICNIEKVDEEAYFKQFHKYITLAVFTGMKMFLQLELTKSYGELYEELKGFNSINGKYLIDEDTDDSRQIRFKIKNADFLTEAYKNEYQGAIYINPTVGDTKNDKSIDIEFAIMKGTTNNTVRFEVTISGQETLGRIYSTETDPKTIINMNNMYYYGLSILNPIIYLFRTCLNYSKDMKVKSYYTELQSYFQRYKDKRTRGLVPKLMEIISLIIYKRPDEHELTSLLDKYFKPTDKAQKAEFRKIYIELQELLPIKKERLIDSIRKELWKVVW